jgi:uncharacterized protein YbjT (DUF2867 family)
MHRASVRRLIVISAAPVGAPPPDDGFFSKRVMMPIVGAILRPVYDDLREMEAELSASDTVWTALRPPRLTNGPLTATYRTVVGSAVARGLSISRADLAHAMLAAVDRPETECAALGVAY